MQSEGLSAICGLFKSPCVGGLGVSENRGVSVVGMNAKVNCIGAAPLIFNRLDEENSVADPKFDRTLIDLVARVGFHLNVHEQLREAWRPAVTGLSRILHAAFSECASSEI